MRRYVTSLMVSIVALVAQASAAEVAVPHDLEQWRGWALQGEDYRRCPFNAAESPANAGAYRCAWPERLALALGAQGGTFEQRWQIYSESWVSVPGSEEYWPQNVQVDGKRGAVVMHENVPSLRLTAGAHTITGRLAWSTRPESVAVDSRTAIVDLTLDGKRVVQPERPGGAVWLGKRRTAEQPARMEVQVYRLLRDSVPATLLTRIRLQVSGDGREELLARVLPEGFTPLSLMGSLPARLEQDGRLRVQVRAGSWEVDVEARAAGVASRVARPPVGEGLWAREEVWSFSGDDRLRVSSAQGADGIDPAQANVPAEWRGFPAFRMAPDSTLEIIERSRGLQNADDNRLTLDRQLWLDFNHGGLTAVDRVRGTMRKDWRLEMTTPYSLESARMNGEPQLVTRNPGRGPGNGLEVRTPNLILETVARTADSRGQIPATGWNARFDNVRGTLNLPPGHRLLAAFGADSAPGAWSEQWGLWGLFGVLVVAVFAGWLAGWIVGVVAFVALLLTYQESPSYIWLWSNLLAGLALARAAPEGRLRQFARGYRTLGFVILGIALLPLLWGQARMALHPQLDNLPSFTEVHPIQADLVESPSPAAPPAEADKSLEEVSVTASVRRDRANRKEAYNAASPMVTAITSSGGLNAQQIVQRYAPGTLLQTGPGIPQWRYVSYGYGWSGPVEKDQSVRFLYIGPVLLGVWRLLGVALLAALFVALLQSSDNGRWQWPDARDSVRKWFSGETRAQAASATGVSVLCAMLLALCAASPVRAEPDANLLNELKARLTRAPECVPNCAEVTAAQVTVRGDRLDISMEVSALANVAVPMPSLNDRWQIDSVSVDGHSALAVGRRDDGALSIPLTPGAHEVRLGGALPAATSIQVEFPSVPRSISVSSDGWDVSGVNEGRLLSGSLELVRRRSSTSGAGALETASEFPAYVRVTRSFGLGLDWTLDTTVTRVAPEKAAVTVEVPLVQGESALSQRLRTREAAGGRRIALVGLERGQDEVAWSSGIARGETLELELPSDSPRSEVWSFAVSPQWNVAFEGLPAVLPQNTDQSTWVYEFYPRPGEKLRLHITRPERAAGATLAIDSAMQRVVFGKRSATTSLQLQYRSTQGGRHGITLPKNARVTSVLLDGQPVQVRPDNGVLSVGLLPGNHAVSAEWEVPTGATARTQPAAVDLHVPASNVRTSVSLPADRWVLFASGAGVGPAILYWSELVVFVITALLLGRWKQSPLRTNEWLLLGLGLSTLSWGVLAIVGLWLFAVAWRERWPGNVSRWRFNSVQVLLAGVTVIAVMVLVFLGIRQSLLASPDMGVTGPGSYGSEFTWFVDHTSSALPQPSVISAPMWVYRALMFAWALWLVVALLRWLRWAWRAWKANGIWRGKVAAAVLPA
ncbi:MAG: hypothetical protein ABI885_15770 [Gammaproteobacteria bacterium]